MSKKYFIRVKGKILGPFSVPQLQDLSARGRFSSFHEVSEDGKTWAEASSLSDVFPQEKDDDVDFIDDTASNAGGAAAFFFIDASGATRGPVTDADFVTLLRCGQVHANTLVWRQGMAQWQPLQSAVILSGVALPPPLPNLAPSTVSSQHNIPPGNAAHPSELQDRHPALSILLHFLTLGVFTFVWLNLLHGKFPRKRANDPSVGQAIGFYYIPLFDFYWVFFIDYRLCVRINEQLQLQGLRSRVPGAIATIRSVFRLMFLIHILLGCTRQLSPETAWPLIGVFLFNLLLFTPVFVWIVQTKINDLVPTHMG